MNEPSGEQFLDAPPIPSREESLAQHPSRLDQPLEYVVVGYYKMEGMPGDYDIYKVQTAYHGSGRRYAKQLVLDNISFADDAFEKLPDGLKDGRTVYTGRWVYKPGAIALLREEHRLSVEEAMEFGKLYGVCVRCGRTLTKEESIERGMGDVCAGKGL